LKEKEITDKLVEVVKASRNITKKTASMWQNYFNLPMKEIIMYEFIIGRKWNLIFFRDKRNCL